jgi:hypothetical protein
MVSFCAKSSGEIVPVTVAESQTILSGAECRTRLWAFGASAAFKVNLKEHGSRISDMPIEIGSILDGEGCSIRCFELKSEAKGTAVAR